MSTSSHFYIKRLRTFDEEEDDGGDEQEGHDDEGGRGQRVLEKGRLNNFKRVTLKSNLTKSREENH